MAIRWSSAYRWASPVDSADDHAEEIEGQGFVEFFIEGGDRKSFLPPSTVATPPWTDQARLPAIF